MTVTTFWDIRRHRRCPHAFALERGSDSVTLTPMECMDLSVHDATLHANRRFVTYGRVDREEALNAFWESWDRHAEDLYPRDVDTIDMIRFGERCMDGYMRTLRRYAPGNIIGVGLCGTVEVPGGEVLAPIDVAYGSGRTVTVCRYVCEPGMGTAGELSKDREMRLCALWALDNLGGYDRARMRWEFLGSGTSTECSVPRRELEWTRSEMGAIVENVNRRGDVLPHESDYCRECPHLRGCPRFLHEESLTRGAEGMSEDEGVRLVDEYAELQDKIDALRRRQAHLETRQRAVADMMVAYSDAHGYMALTGHDRKALVRHERRVELPEDKTELIARLRETGQYDSLSIPNYSRLRSDIAKGVADPEVARMATVTDVGKVYLRKRAERRRRHAPPVRRDRDLPRGGHRRGNALEDLTGPGAQDIVRLRLGGVGAGVRGRRAA